MPVRNPTNRTYTDLPTILRVPSCVHSTETPQLYIHVRPLRVTN